jgi:hypothetical protein
MLALIRELSSRRPVPHGCNIKYISIVSILGEIKERFIMLWGFRLFGYSGNQIFWTFSLRCADFRRA